MSAILSVRDLRISFPSQRGELVAVDGIDLDIEAAEFSALVGESGCGKSVTALALLGLLKPAVAQVSAASFSLDGHETGLLDERGWRQIRGRDIAMISQEPMTALDPVMKVGQQLVRVIRRHRSESHQQATRTAAELLNSVGFNDPDETRNSYPHQLSGGMRQRVVIAMAMACRPKLLIADEPTTALDVTTQAEVLHQLRRLRDNHGTAVLLITHDLSIVAQTCEQVRVMYCGRIVEQASCADLFSTPAHPYSAGLLAAVPRLSADKPRPVQEIPGSVPDLLELPPGCRFSNRCERSDDLCTSNMPLLTASGSAVCACHHPLGATE
jgi:oligopeptide/dipeptide ABC transporter ATP-binding protein